MDEQIRLSKSYQFKAVLPNTLNANDTRFGSQSMQWMDEVAYITATRFTRQHMFIVNTENIKFLKAANANCFVEVIGRIENVEAVKLKVKVEIFVEKMYARAHDKAIEGIFIFA
jgi:acyl-CoA hydrolase